MTFKPFLLEKPPYRIISFDGGGIFGYFTALMLRKLCEDNPEFLDGTDNPIFAGISAGALNALILAREARPRDAILRGDLEKVYDDPRLFSNLDPITAVTSLLGFSAWCSGPLMKDLAKSIWGDRTIGELPQRVIIETFNFTGKSQHSDQVMWQPKTFRNFGPDNQSNVSAAFLAYGSTAPATYRPVEQGISDAGYYAINPVMGAVGLIGSMDLFEKSYWQFLERMVTVFDNFSADYAGVLNGLRLSGGASDYATLRTSIHARIGIVHDNVTQIRDLLVGLETPEDPELVVIINHLIQDMTDILDSGHFGEHLPATYEINDTVDGISRHFQGFIEIWEKIVEHSSFISEPTRESNWYEVYTKLKEDLYGVDGDGVGGFFERVKVDPENLSDFLLDIVAFEIPQTIHSLFEALFLRRQDRLDHIQAFSMGIGNFTPGYTKSDFDVGFLNFNLHPTNASQQVYLPPPFNLMLDPGLEATTEQAKHILGDRFMRFNPPAMTFPIPNVMISLYLVRFEYWRKHVLRGIHGKSKDVPDAMFKAAQAWLKHHGWIERIEPPKRDTVKPRRDTVKHKRDTVKNGSLPKSAKAS